MIDYELDKEQVSYLLDVIRCDQLQDIEKVVLFEEFINTNIFYNHDEERYSEVNDKLYESLMEEYMEYFEEDEEWKLIKKQ